MYQRLFQISIVLFLLVVSIAVLGVAISVLMSMLSPHLMAETSGIIVISGGVTNRQLGYIIVAASLIVAGFFLFFRRRRFRR
jgi:nitrate reductase gamma subunit